jgi:hypothetical protein
VWHHIAKGQENVTNKLPNDKNDVLNDEESEYEAEPPKKRKKCVLEKNTR